MTEVTPADDSLRPKKTLTWIVYGLYAASFLVGITSIVAIILNYVKRGVEAVDDPGERLLGTQAVVGRGHFGHRGNLHG